VCFTVNPILLRLVDVVNQCTNVLKRHCRIEALYMYVCLVWNNCNFQVVAVKASMCIVEIFALFFSPTSTLVPDLTTHIYFFVRLKRSLVDS